jgi:hypothetical protein
MKQILYQVTILTALTAWIGGCATQTRLEPAPVETMAMSDEQCIGACEGVRLIADPDAWRGTPEVVEEITPIKVTIENRHGSAIRVLYSHFALISPPGKRFSALPPFAIEGEVEVAAPPPPPGVPMFHSRDFFVSPFHHHYVPGVPTAGEPFPYDPFYYDRYYGEWEEIELPTDYMKSAALPEGDIRDQGEVAGFLYFEKVVGVEDVELHMDLMEAEDGTIFGRIRIPFNVVD